MYTSCGLAGGAASDHLSVHENIVDAPFAQTFLSAHFVHRLTNLQKYDKGSFGRRLIRRMPNTAALTPAAHGTNLPIQQQCSEL